jgi:uncharacterized phage protein (TIGR01671 family)
MNNRFKFKIWNNTAKCFVESFNEPVATFTLLSLSEYLHSNSISNIDNFTFLQFTGLTDSNKNEIYEGDIVQYNNGDVIRIGYVGFMAGIFFLNYNDEIHDELGYLLILDLKIIGNIFENPELLK